MKPLFVTEIPRIDEQLRRINKIMDNWTHAVFWISIIGLTAFLPLLFGIYSTGYLILFVLYLGFNLIADTIITIVLKVYRKRHRELIAEQEKHVDDMFHNFKIQMRS